MASTSETRLFAAILIAAGLLVAIVVVGVRSPGTDLPPAPRLVRGDLLVPGMRFRGNLAAPYVLVEFGDYQCPDCRSAEPDVDELIQTHADKVCCAFVYMCAVARDEHPYAELLAMSAEAAGEQGRFWQMHDELFREQSAFAGATPAQARARLVTAASRADVDSARMLAAMESAQVRAAVDRDKLISAKARVTQTPWFYVVPPGGVPIRLGTLDAAVAWFEDLRHLR